MLSLRERWHPIAASSDLPYRHVFHAQLLGRELAVWRADDDYVNVWENRCLHRGVRLSIGLNDGVELRCQYHGWRYANRSAGCTYIPAHPADAPARTITNRRFPAVERHGLVWSGEDPQGEVGDIPGLAADDALVLRGIAVDAPAAVVVGKLRSYRGWRAAEAEPTGSSHEDELSVVLPIGRDDGGVCAFFVQPVDASRCVIRGVAEWDSGMGDRLTCLRRHNQDLSALRDEAEREAAALPAPEPMTPEYERVAPELAVIPELGNPGRRAALRVQVARKWMAAEGVAGIELRPIEGVLPTFQPGAHIDVHLPNGLIRQYSVTNAPGATDSFVIGVKREPESTGGSSCLHEQVRDGDVLAISEPRNNFPLRRDATRTILVAGGIGITPILAMASALHNSALAYELHCFAQSQAHLAFANRLDDLNGAVTSHLGLAPQETEARLAEIVSGYEPMMHLYLCGPGPMIDAARRLADAAGWPEDAVHYEHFKNTNELTKDSSFEIALARSGLTLQVPAGKTILEVMRDAGVHLQSSCEQGACGTCLATVIEGEPDHQDVYLSDSERRSGTKIMTCVSRAKSARLVLDV